jgi:hypothetical protein
MQGRSLNFIVNSNATVYQGVIAFPSLKRSIPALDANRRQISRINYMARKR